MLARRQWLVEFTLVNQDDLARQDGAVDYLNFSGRTRHKTTSFPQLNGLFVGNLNHEIHRSSAARLAANSSTNRFSGRFADISAAALRHEWRTVV